MVDKKKLPAQKASKVVFDKKFRSKRLRITVDRFNWIVDYGADTLSFGSSRAKYYSNIQSMCLGLEERIIRSLTKEINPAHIRNVVTESEDYLIDMAGDIKKMFEASAFKEVAFATPEQRHAENNIENDRKNEPRKGRKP